TLPLDKVGELYTEYQIKEGDQTYVGSVPKDPEKMSKQKQIPYGNLLEFVAERFHCDHELLTALNPGKDLNALKPGDTIVVPNVQPFEIEKIAAEGKEDVTVAGDKESKVELHVNTSSSLLELKEGDKVVGSYPVTPGSDEKATPKGTWEVKFMAQMPTYKWDTKMFKGEGKGGEEGRKYTIPPGVNNPVGVIWMQLTPDGVGMHGTPEPETIGRAGSHGCIRLSNWDAIDLSSKISKGTKVVIE
ncbi:MAG: L,D-transpeptidase, partial [Verrucomicrobiaceae bacterium]